MIGRPKPGVYSIFTFELKNGSSVFLLIERNRAGAVVFNFDARQCDIRAYEARILEYVQQLRVGVVFGQLDFPDLATVVHLETVFRVALNIQ